MKIKFEHLIKLITEEITKDLTEEKKCPPGMSRSTETGVCYWPDVATTSTAPSAPTAPVEGTAEKEFEATRLKLLPLAEKVLEKAEKCNKQGYLGYAVHKSSPEHERQVKLLQQKLIDLKHMPPSMPPDGIFGDNTLIALLDFQLSKFGRRGADGCMGPSTERKLGLGVLKTLKHPARKKYAKSRVKASSSKTAWAKETYETAKNILGDTYGAAMPQLVVTFGAVESGWGKKSIGNNMFGIKAPMSACKEGRGQYVSTTEVVRGIRTPRKSCFADYETKEEAIEKFSRFLKGKRFKDGFDFFPDAPAFVVAWAWVNGYATAERYVQAQVNMAKSVARRTKISEFNWEFPEELKKAVKLLGDTQAMEDYALTDVDIEAQRGGTRGRRRLKKYLSRSKDPNLSQRRRDNYAMMIAGTGRRYLGKKLVARAYALWKGESPIEAQKLAEKAARTGYGALKLPMPNEEQIVTKAEKMTAYENSRHTA